MDAPADSAAPMTEAAWTPRLRKAPAWRPLVVPVALAALLIAGLLLSLAMGAAGLELAEVRAALAGEAGTAAHTIVWSLRMPRAVLACLVGLNLAVSGTLLQAILRNPLAAPDIVGVTAGAGLTATATLVLFQGLPTFLPLTAFIGAMGAAVCVYGISWQPGMGTSPVRMVLAASAVSVAGLIGFVGLIVPHLIRLLVGHQYARLLPASAAGGAALLLWADLGARTMLAPTELPVGILTAILGGPYFVFLLYRKKLL